MNWKSRAHSGKRRLNPRNELLEPRSHRSSATSQRERERERRAIFPRLYESRNSIMEIEWSCLPRRRWFMDLIRVWPRWNWSGANDRKEERLLRVLFLFFFLFPTAWHADEPLGRLNVRVYARELGTFSMNAVWSWTASGFQIDPSPSFFVDWLVADIRAPQMLLLLGRETIGACIFSLLPSITDNSIARVKLERRSSETVGRFSTA